MITNESLTIYHKTFNPQTRLEEWVRYNYLNVWFFGSKGAGINKGYDNANNVDIRIPYDVNEVDVANIKIGDILVKGNLALDITTQQDLVNFDVYNITMVNDNNFGNNPHIHIGGK